METDGLVIGVACWLRMRAAATAAGKLDARAASEKVFNLVAVIHFYEWACV